METYLSHTYSGRVRDQGRFNFGVIMEGGGGVAEDTTSEGSGMFVFLWEVSHRRSLPCN